MHVTRNFCNFAAFRGMRDSAESSSFYFNKTYMIDKNVVKKLVDEWLADKEYFLVGIDISPDDKIVVEIDHADGVWIEDCVALSKYIEDRLSRDEEDYELEVGSDADWKKFQGVLKSVDGNDFTVTVNEKVKVEGKKRPQKMDVDHAFKMDNVKYTKYLISFK